MRCITLYNCFVYLFMMCSACNPQVMEMSVKGVQFLYQIYQYENNNMRTTIINQKLTEQIHYLNLMNSIEELKLKIERLQLDEPDVTNMKARMYDLQICSGAITERYEEYIKYSENQSLYDTLTLEAFYKEVINENEGVPKLLFNIHEQIVGLRADSLLNVIDKYIEYIDPYCQKRLSRQQYFYNLFISIVSHELKGFFTLEYAYNLKRQLENKTLSQELKDLFSLRQTRINSTVSAFYEVMSRAEQSVWKCDPKKHVENHTYVELKNVFRRIFYDARDFSWDFNSISCTSTKCPEIREGKPIEPKCDQGICFLHQRHCNSVVMCKQIQNEQYNVCVSKDQKQGSRYKYVHDASKELFNRDQTCDGQFRAVFKLVQSYPGSFSEAECNMCDCICDESRDSDHYISLKPVTSDSMNNYIVTGVKFELVHHTLYIKIQQGKLLKSGFISRNSVSWKDISVASDKVGERVIKNKEKSPSQPSHNTTSSSFYTFEGKEKFKLEWHRRRGLYLDDLELKEGSVVTGIRFALDALENGDVNIMLDLQATPFDLVNGKLMTENSTWISSFTAAPKRSKLYLESYDSPTLLNVTNKPDDELHQHTFFTPSAFTSKDAGQTLLPLIDIQPVTSDPPIPLMGVSLDIKRAENSGGYLMLKIKTYNTLWFINH